MVYIHNLTIPSKQEEEYPFIEIMSLVKGLIYQIGLLFPPGCAGLAHVMIKDGLHQIWPSKEKTWFSSDAETISFDETYEILHDPAQINIVGYNEDDTWHHTITVRIGIVDKEIYQARYLPHLAYKLTSEEDKKERGIKSDEMPITQPLFPFSYKQGTN